jgi:cell division protein FtsL
MYALMLLVMIVVTAVNMILHIWEQRVLVRRQGRR